MESPIPQAASALPLVKNHGQGKSRSSLSGAFAASRDGALGITRRICHFRGPEQGPPLGEGRDGPNPLSTYDMRSGSPGDWTSSFHAHNPSDKHLIRDHSSLGLELLSTSSVTFQVEGTDQ